MRPLKIMMAAGVLIAPLPLMAQQAAPQRPERQVVCNGLASGAQGEEVSVSIYVEPDGTRVGSAAYWAPPQLDQTNARALDLPDLRFEQLYSEATASAIGPPQYALVLVSVFSPLRKRENPAALYARLDRLSLSISFDDGPSSPFAFLPVGTLGTDLPGSAMRSASLTLPKPFPLVTTITLTDNRGKQVVRQRYATGSTASRDALFIQAWQQADAATANLMTCDLTGSGLAEIVTLPDPQ